MLEIPDAPKILLDNAPRVKETRGRSIIMYYYYYCLWEEERGKRKEERERRK